MTHIALLGDSIFDNKMYVGSDANSVSEHLNEITPEGVTVSLQAVDGSVTSDTIEQLGDVPDGVTHVFISSGGNDALSVARRINEPKPTGVAMLEDLVAIQESFREVYRRMLKALTPLNVEKSVCTIYDMIPGLSARERMGLSLFNDVIVREAAFANVPVLDIRPACDDPVDYAAISPIEPSAIGGRKIARAIWDVVQAR